MMLLGAVYDVVDVDDFVQPKFEGKIEIEGYEQDTGDLAQIQALGELNFIIDSQLTSLMSIFTYY